MSFSNEPTFDEPAKTESIENALGTSLKVSSSKIFLLLSTLYILGRVAGKICIHLSQLSQTTALCCKNISVVSALYLMLQILQYCVQNYAGITRQTLPDNIPGRAQALFFICFCLFVSFCFFCFFISLQLPVIYFTAFLLFFFLFLSDISVLWAATFA